MHSNFKDSSLSNLLQKIAEAPEDFRILKRLDISQEFAGNATLSEDVWLGVILDTETTGTDNTKDALVELGLVYFTVCKATLRVKGIFADFCQFDDPGIPISPEASAINGITDEMIKGERLDEDILNDSLSRVDFIIAHNATFDRQICERRLPAFANVPWGCSLKQVDWAGEEIASAKLNYIAFELGFFFTGHRAIIDCFALLYALDQPLPVSKTTGLQQILSKLNVNTKRIAATGAPYDAKDKLKANGYFWEDGTKPNTEKAWTKEIAESELDAELQWLKEHCFRGSKIGIPVRNITSLNRFTNRYPAPETVYC